MPTDQQFDMQRIAHITGWALLASIGFGILTSILLFGGIDVNMTADVLGTAENMLDAETRLKAKAYIGLFTFGITAVINVGFYLLLRRSGPLLAGTSLFISLAASTLILLGTMFAMNASHIVGNADIATLTDETGRLGLLAQQVISDYTSFHLGLVASTAANAGFFYLFLKSGLMPKFIAGWGVFASMFVVIVIVARDFIPALGHNGLTIAFMLCNLIALISAGVYLSFKGVR